MNYTEDEIQHGRNKISKRVTPHKSKHKHDYIDIGLKETYKDGLSCITPAQQCSICGKLKCGFGFFMIPVEGKHYCKKILTREDEILKAYPNLKIVEK